MKTNLGILRTLALTAFVLMSLGRSAQAQVLATDCHDCGACTCCDENGKLDCFIDCGSTYCDCCGDECVGNHCF